MPKTKEKYKMTRLFFIGGTPHVKKRKRKDSRLAPASLFKIREQIESSHQNRLLYWC